MRGILRPIRNFRSAYKCTGYNILNGFPNRQCFGVHGFLIRPHSWVNKITGSAYSMSQNSDFCTCRKPCYLMSSSLHTDAATVTDAEINRSGPLVEYERRVSAGELMDGDICQLGTLRELQRLYDELVEQADACRLDRYAASEKGGSLFQEQVVVVAFHTTVFFCSSQRTLSLWRSWHWENYVNGHAF